MQIHCQYSQLVPVKELKAHPKNRNEHPKDQLERLAKILEYQGWRYPIKVSKLSGFITSGHGRLAAAKLLKLKEVPVSFQDYTDEAQEYADLQADNAIASWSELDLSAINSDIVDLGPDFDIDLLGIKDFVVEPADKLDPQCDEDEVPDALPEPKVVRGEVYILGKHRLMCGDSTAITDVERLMGKEKADGLFTDPPYNIDFKPPRGTHDRILNDAMEASEFTDWLSEVFSCARAAAKKDSFAFVWCGWSTVDQFAPVLRNFYEIKAMPIWLKNNFGIGYYSRPKYEPFFLFLNGKPPTPETAPADVWEHAKVHKTIHSCEKPVGLIEEILKVYNVSGAILDLFGGSGSTLIACEKTDRQCFMMELDPHYCGVILDRWQKFTGKKAHREDGVPWDEIKAE